MTSDLESILPFNQFDPGLAAASEALLDRAFGLGRRTKTTYRLREGEQPVDGLSFGTWLGEGDGGRLVAVISYWRLCIGEAGHEAIMLGPLAVEPGLQRKGLGRRLMDYSLQEAAKLGHPLVILVGDAPYYEPSGFVQVPDGKLLLPGPVDPARLMYRDLKPGALEPVSGLVLAPKRYAAKGPRV